MGNPVASDWSANLRRKNQIMLLPFIPGHFSQEIHQLQLGSQMIDHSLTKLDCSLSQLCFRRLKDKPSTSWVETLTTDQYQTFDPF